MPSHTLTRRALITGAGTVVASAAMAVPYVKAARAADVCSEPIAPEDLDDRLKSAVGYVQAVLKDMGCDEYLLLMREEKAGVLTLLDFEPGTGELRRKLDLA